VPRAIALPAPSYPLVRTTLANGLRVVLAPDRSAPVVGVAVYYDVGIRSEPQGRTGFAHLFEHLMFQGSANLEKLEHFRYVQSSGGTFNGSTHMDYTRYFEVLPSNALERGLFLEADRMRSPRITEENLANQIAVVKEEIRVNVLNRPYGGFPWILLPPVAFSTFANSHNGYGDFVDLETSTVADAAEFFDRYYAPANAVLCVAGDLDPDTAMALIERHFGDIPARPAPERPTFAEPDLTAERRHSTVDALAPIPAVAAAWRVPDPVGGLTEYLPYMVLAEILSDGDSSRLEQRLVQRDRSVTQLSAYLGLMGDPFDVRDPTVLIFQAFHPQASADQVLDSVTEEVDRVATGGLQAGELDRVRARIVAQLFRDIDPVLGRTLALAALEQQHGRADLLMDLPGLLGAVTEEQIRSAAAMLRPDRRAVLELVPGGQPAAAPAAEAPARRRGVKTSRPAAKAARTTRPAKAAKKAAKATRPAKGTKSARPVKAGTAVRPAKAAIPTKAAKATKTPAKAAKAPAKAAKAAKGPAKAAKAAKAPAKAAKATRAKATATRAPARASKATPAKKAAAKAAPGKATRATASKAAAAKAAKTTKAAPARASRAAPAKNAPAKAAPAKNAPAKAAPAKNAPAKAAKAAKATRATAGKATRTTKVAGPRATKATKTTGRSTQSRRSGGAR
jgi:zinc protease